ncbi:hypothetical protein GCM10011505_05420 [Tistrella bauzanensis]|uniref:NHLP leader peptide family natural product n=1 Tax=Tistrella bauzanensis TaxID=657419 RepID=A0ABQ1IAH8_9PROT|nr:hypothetical protein [Tistrella bauzanensis]GGB27003.1 hypothetical protein GCM10011505_05420 [Tistrella bauzanensis]
MADVTQRLADLLRQAASDADLRARLRHDPLAALADAGLDVPEGCEVTVLEDRAELMHLVLPSPLMAYDDIDEGNAGEDIVTVGKAAFASGLFPRADPVR